MGQLHRYNSVLKLDIRLYLVILVAIFLIPDNKWTNGYFVLLLGFSMILYVLSTLKKGITLLNAGGIDALDSTFLIFTLFL